METEPSIEKVHASGQCSLVERSAGNVLHVKVCTYELHLMLNIICHMTAITIPSISQQSVGQGPRWNIWERTR